ncbi:hypothetical protein KFK09_027043 [Dendrobium nobile]|uniref:Uncharacterized protein n=1 Tax=Dendrobium nobile TaxID=94219 RepID=A0A8T3A8K4_DENNO|nr:hypothetical protein KFK09_027043 [Dendrobium nobile]
MLQKVSIAIIFGCSFYIDTLQYDCAVLVVTSHYCNIASLHPANFGCHLSSNMALTNASTSAKPNVKVEDNVVKLRLRASHLRGPENSHSYLVLFYIEDDVLADILNIC